MKLFRFVLTIIHFSVIVLLSGTFLNAYVPPKIFPYFNLLSLGFPVLMILNILLCIFWIITVKKRMILFLAASLMFINPAKRWINFNKENSEKPNLKIVSMNIHSGLSGYGKIYDYLQKQNADIVIGQEYLSEFNVPGYAYIAKDFPIVAINSKTEIIRQEKLTIESEGNAFYADIKFNGKILRIVNVYLNPFSFEKDEMKLAENMEQNQKTMYDVLKRLVPTFKIHQEEVSEIRKAIDNSPYPVILAGDFNAVPNSYEYYHLGKNLQDAFVETGNGSATSFHDYKFPIRIDYVFCSKEIKPISYKVDRNVHLSDHFPVIAEFKID